MIKIIDDIGKQYIDKNDKSDKSIYNFYNSYKKSLKANNNNNNKSFIVLEKPKKENKVVKQKEKGTYEFQDNFIYYLKEVDNKNLIYKLEISYPDFIIDAIQEISNIIISATCKPISEIYENDNVKTTLPKTIICNNIFGFKNNIDIKEKINIIISFEGVVTGCFLISFDKQAVIKAQTMLESRYKKYYISLQSILISYLKEMATILAETSIWKLYEMLSYQMPKGEKMENIKIDVITTSLYFLDDFYNYDSIISVMNVCSVHRLTNINIYSIFNIYQAKIITDKMQL